MSDWGLMAQLDNRWSRSILLLCALIAAALCMDNWQRTAQRHGRSMWFDNIVCTFSAPIQVSLGAFFHQVDASWQAIRRGKQLVENNKRLSARVSELQMDLMRLEEKQAAQMREHILRSGNTDRGGCVADVIGVGRDGWHCHFVVDRGSEEGTHLHDVALSGGGVVGQVYAVSSHTARVLPITEPASGVAALIQRSREPGILRGLGNWRCELRYLSPDADVRPGDKLLTAGTGGIFPKGLFVGTVTAIMEDPRTPGKIAQVSPAANLRKIEEVLLLRGGGLDEFVPSSPAPNP